MELHSNAFVAVSKQLADLIREQRFPFQLYYHPITAIEFRSVIDHYHRKLAGGRWQPGMSRVLLRVGDLSGVERRYHEINAEQPIAVDDFFTRYSNLDRLLSPSGITPYRIVYEPWLKDDTTLDLISRYKGFLEPREKPFEVLQHDIILWRTLQTVRQNNPGPFGAGAFFLTCDYTFWRFDHSKLRRGSAGASVLPNVLLQLLRPFVPRTVDFDLSFVSTFALPEFRTIHAATDQAVSRVAGIIRLYADLPEEVAVAILTDDALLSKVTDLEDSDPSIHDLIESAIAAEASRWKEEAERLRGQVAYEQRNAELVSGSLARESEAAAENVRALEATNLRLVQERDFREAAERSALAEREESERLHRADVAVLAERTRLAEDHAASARAVAESEKKERVAETSRLRSVIRTFVHIAIAFGASAIVVRYFALTVSQYNSIIVGAGVYSVGAAAAELSSWFRLRRHRVLIRIFWFLSALAGVVTSWFTTGHVAELSIGITVFVAVAIPLTILCFQSEP